MSQNPVAALMLRKNGYLFGFITCFGIVAAALFIQTQNNLEPCPLCITQRIFFMVLGLLFLIGAFLKPKSFLQKVMTFFQVIAAFGGAGWAARHWYIQANKESMISDCGVGFDYMFQEFPLEKALTLLFKGTGDCAAIDWTLWGLTLPQLGLIAFVFYALYAIWLAVINRKAETYF